MLQRVVRHPATLTAIAAAIVLAAATVAAPYVAPRMQRQDDRVEQVSVIKRVVHDRVAFSANASSSAPSIMAPASSLVAPHIAKTANLTLYVSDVDAAAAKIGALAHREGGDVFALDVSSQTGNIEVRVPVENFDATMSAVARVGNVRERVSSAEDLSANITDSSAKLRNLRRTEGDILHIMDRSGTVEQVLNVENQLSDVRGQIEQLEADIKSMRQRVAYSTITAELDAEPATVQVQPSAGAQLVNQWNDAVAHLGRLSLSIVAIVMWLVVFAPYIAIPVVIVWLLARRRKDAGLA